MTRAKLAGMEQKIKAFSKYFDVQNCVSLVRETDGCIIQNFRKKTQSSLF